MTVSPKAPHRILFWHSHDEALAWIFENGGTIAAIPGTVDGMGNPFEWGKDEEE